MGSILAAWVTYGTFRLENTWSWRIPSLLQGVPSLVQIFLVFWLVPESPRWLVSHGRIPEARAILLKWHCNGDETDPLIDFEMHEITEGIRLDQEIAQTTTYRSLFATPGNRRRMLAIIPYSFFSQWSGVSHCHEVSLDYMLITRTVSSRITSTLPSKVSVSPRPNNKISSMVCFSYGTS
jgi:MFS family permease